MPEENPFERSDVAQEWISAIETGRGGSARENEIYPRITQWLASSNFKTVVDIGCGQGDISSRIHHIQYFGVEPSLPLFERAKELHTRDKTKFFLGSAYELPFRDGEIDAAFSIGVWFHLQHLNQAANELARILRSGGEFYIITSNPNLHNLWERFFADQGPYRKNGNKIAGSVGAGTWKLSHNVFYLHTMNELEESFRQSGLLITNVEKFGYTGEHGDEGIWMGIRGTKS